MPGRHRQVASPESMTLDRWVMGSGSPHPLSGLPRSPLYDAHIANSRCAVRPGMTPQHPIEIQNRPTGNMITAGYDRAEAGRPAEPE